MPSPGGLDNLPRIPQLCPSTTLAGATAMDQKRKHTAPTVCIVESLGFLEENTHKEGEIIARTLRLSNKQTHYSYVRSHDELVAFAKEFGSSGHRYLHISCHGNAGFFFTTTGKIAAKDFARVLAPHVDKRRVFLSACLAAKSDFATELLTNSECWSVLAPVGEIYFDDAAIFWTAFYHLIFKENPDSMNRARIEKTVEQCAILVGEKFRFFYRDKGRVVAEMIG
jgi:hypothetical protein